ncbi:MAG: hypothetical protein HZB13_08150 [Acidobacteria bacterium]|nr:hypothetical protein [Acidobacteriota bacterium]
MSQFASSRDALQFLVGRIVSEARRQGVPLSEAERNMLYFSESGSATPGLVVADLDSERESGQAEYEEKIARLIRSARNNARGEASLWTDAIAILSKEDYYLLVMIGRAGGPDDRTRDLLLLWVTGLAVVLGLFALFHMADRAGLPVQTDSLRGILWTAILCVAGALALFGAFARRRAEALLRRLAKFLLGG